jgi:hypothetical protein
MRSVWLTWVLVLCLLLTSTLPAMAAEVPEPFCGDLDEEDCDVLRASSAAMLDLESYTTTVEYKIFQHGLPELPPESEAVLRLDGEYAFDDAARDSILTLASISREEPLAAVEAIGEARELLLDLYSGMTSQLVLTLDLSESWTRTLQDEADVEWPETTTVEVRLVDGVLYFDIHELKEFIPELAELDDWVAIELVQTLEQLAEEGAFAAVASEVAASSEGRSIWGLDPTMLNLITTMRSAFGRPQNLWPYMEIRRRRDVDLADQEGALFQTEFDALDFILSDEFRDVLMQVVQIAVANDEMAMEEDELDEMVSLFWLVAPVIFRDLETSGESVIGLDDNYQHHGESLFHWDLTTLLQTLIGLSGEEDEELAEEIYIDFTTEFENSAFNEAVTVEAPEDAQIIPLEDLEMEGLDEFN